MCGIVGFFSAACPPADRGRALGRMAGALVHRGPDAEGGYSDQDISLGHRRLSIIDLSAQANQPMEDASGRLVIVFNGEIYNYRQLRQELAAYPYRTDSDTEVILAAFSKWGEHGLARLKGQFSIAIWDKAAKRLFIARDRLGEKPFYYHSSGASFVFASELRSLLASGLVRGRVSSGAVVDYLVYESVRAPDTILEDVFQLPPGHYAWVDASGISVHRYWDILDAVPAYSGEDYPAVCRRVKSLLDSAVEGQMLSDVPLGIFLSGGIDSSALVGLAAERSTRRVHTLSIVFQDGDFDESRYSGLIARRFDTSHQEIRLRPESLLEELPGYFDRLDTPSGDGVNTYVIAKAAKAAGLTVALSGIGGDELFAGYRYFQRYAKYMSQGGAWRLPRAVMSIASLLPDTFFGARRRRKMRGLAALAPSDPGRFYELARSSFLRNEAESAVPGARAGGPQNRHIVGDKFRSIPLLSQYSVLEFSNYTRNVLLKDADNMGLANSLEIRVPFCDHELVQYVLSVPDRFKYPSRPKKLLVDSLGGLLPGEVVDRPKMGFSFPWGKWMREELNSLCGSSVSSLAQRGVLDGAAITGLWKEFEAGHSPDSWSRVWQLVVLERWLQKNSL